MSKVSTWTRLYRCCAMLQRGAAAAGDSNRMVGRAHRMEGQPAGADDGRGVALSPLALSSRSLSLSSWRRHRRLSQRRVRRTNSWIQRLQERSFCRATPQALSELAMDVSRSSTQIRRRSRSGFSAAADMPHATSEQRAARSWRGRLSRSGGRA